MPYTYFIKWTHSNMKYYGVRYAKRSHPDEFWKTYFTSSKHVSKYRKEHGEPDIIEIRKIFSDVKSAQLWEHRVLKRLNVVLRDDYLNMTDNKAIAYKIHPNTLRKGELSPHYGKKLSAETKERISRGVLASGYKTPVGPANANYGRPSPFRGKKRPELSGENHAFYGIPTNQHPRYNKKHSESSKTKFREINSGRGNPSYDHTSYSFEHPEHGIFSGTRHELKNAFPEMNINVQSLGKVANKLQKRHLKWSLC